MDKNQPTNDLNLEDLVKAYDQILVLCDNVTKAIAPHVIPVSPSVGSVEQALVKSIEVRHWISDARGLVQSIVESKKPVESQTPTVEAQPEHKESN